MKHLQPKSTTGGPRVLGLCRAPLADRPATPPLRTIALVLLTLLVGALLAGCVTTTPSDDDELSGKLVIFHHSSVRAAIDAAEAEFKAKYPKVEVQRERSGSTSAIRKVTEQGKVADVVMAGDYNLLQNLMVPDHAEWWVRYSTDGMALTYTDRSTGASELTADNWYEIMRRPGVRWGLADPNIGPDGYFALAVMQLTEIQSGDDQIFEDLVEAHSAITATASGERFSISVPEDLKPQTSVLLVRPSPTDLLPLLESGEIDYAFQYRSEALSTNVSGIKVLTLPDTVNLANPANEPTYGRVSVTTYSDVAGRSVTTVIGTKANGFTIPKVAENEEAAVAFLKILLGPIGQKALTDNSITTIVPAQCSAKSKAPSGLQPLLVQR